MDFLSSNKILQEKNHKLKKQRTFLLTGYFGIEKQKLISLLNEVQASYILSVQSIKDIRLCTHVIAKKPCKSEKFLYACASGKWILIDKYLKDCHQQRKWLLENDYEWGRQTNLTASEESLATAAMKWRDILNNNGNPPFQDWVVGLLAKRWFSVYKRLIEIGGGKIQDLSGRHNEFLTHVIAEKNYTDQLLDYQKRGIPCLHPEYIADYLIQGKMSSMINYSLFSVKSPSNSKSTSECSSLKEITRTDIPTSVRASAPSTVGAHFKTGTEKLPSNCDRLIEEEPIDQLTKVDLGSSFATIAKSDAVSSTSTLKEKNRVSFTNFSATPVTCTETTRITSSCLRHHDVPCDVNASNTSTNSCELKLLNKSVEVFENEGPDLKAVVENDTSEFQNKMESESAPQTDQEWANIRVFPLESNSSQSSACKDLNDSDKLALEPAAREGSSVFTLFKSFGLKADEEPSIKSLNEDQHELKNNQKKMMKIKQKLIEEALAMLRDRKNVARSVPSFTDCAQESTILPRRFGNREMTMLESFVDASHTKSVLLSCRMLVSEFLYPPPDLLFLLMKKYFMESDSSCEVHSVYFILNRVLSFHPPSSSHIKEDDIYSKAFGITDCVESTLLTVSKLELDQNIRLWNNTERDPQEWNFFSAVLKMSLRAVNSPQKRRNALLLLSFIVSVFEQHSDLVKKIFYISEHKCRSKPLNILMKYFRNTIENIMKEEIPDDVDGDENQKDHDNISSNITNVTNSNQDINEDSDDESDDGDDLNELELDKRLLESLVKIINSLISQSMPSSDLFRDIFRRLAKSFKSSDEKIIDFAFSLLLFKPQTIAYQTFLEATCSDCLAQADQDNPLCLELIVQRYLRFVPKLLNSNKKTNQSPSRSSLSSSDEIFTNLTKSQSPRDHVKFTSVNVNRRNLKGETPLHRACIHNQPGRVAQLLAISGVDPNSRDNAGWTSLSEACNRGYVECVRELLRLPLQSTNDNSDTYPLIIDLLACPEEGMTPLHDALNNEHVDVARMLLEKGGVELLYVTDREGRTPLDICATEELRSIILEIALEIGSKVASQSMDDDSISDSTELPSYFLPDEASYKQVLPEHHELESISWLNACRIYSYLVRRLVTCYIAEKKLLTILIFIKNKKETDFSIKSDLTSFQSVHVDEKRTEVSFIEQDLAYLMHWEAFEIKFKKHLQTLCGNSPFISTFNFLNKEIKTILLNIIQA